MGYFNPITYFIKTFIRFFTRKFFWVLLIVILLFLGFIIFNNNGVFAETIGTESDYGYYNGFSSSETISLNKKLLIMSKA